MSIHETTPQDIVFTDLALAELKPIKWVVENLLPVGLVVLGGPPKSNKSTLTIAAALRVAGYLHRVLPGAISKVPFPGVVVVFSAEALAGELRHMVEVDLGVKLTPNGMLIVSDEPLEFMLDDKEGRARLFSWLNYIKPRLVILDPFRNYHTQDEKDSADVVGLVAPLRKWAVDNDACFIIVHHARKLPDDTDRAYNAGDLRGSGALFGAADGVLMMSPRGDMTFHISAVFKRAKSWERVYMLSAFDFKGRPAGEAMGAVEKKVTEVLAVNGPSTCAQVAAKANTTKAKVEAALTVLERNGYVERKDDTYALPGFGASATNKTRKRITEDVDT